MTIRHQTQRADVADLELKTKTESYNALLESKERLKLAKQKEEDRGRTWRRLLSGLTSDMAELHTLYEQQASAVTSLEVALAASEQRSGEHLDAVENLSRASDKYRKRWERAQLALKEAETLKLSDKKTSMFLLSFVVEASFFPFFIF